MIPRAHRRAAATAFLGCFGLYAYGLAPSIYWLDSSEFAAAAFEMGVAHPPGHPLALLVGKALALVPLGDVAFRVGLASALLGAAAAGLTALLAAELVRRMLSALPPAATENAVAPASGAARGTADAPAAPGDPWIEGLAGAGAGFGFGASYAAAFQAVRPEVYALHAALVLGAIHALARSDGTGARLPLYLGALLLGLALANHHYLALVAVAGAAPFLIWRATRERRSGRDRARAALICGGMIALGLCTYAWLPARASRHPEVDWGVPLTVGRFLWTVSAQIFQRAVHRVLAEPPAQVLYALAAELHIAAPAAALGAWALVRQSPTRRIGLLCLGVAAADTAATAVFFDSTNPDNHGYLEVAVALGAAIAATAPALFAGLLAQRFPARGRAAGAVLVAAAGLAWCASAADELPRSLRTRFRDTARHSAGLLDGAPPRAAILSTDFQTVFALWYLRGVEGQRPDLDHLHPHFLPNPGYREEAERRAPELARRIEDLGSPGLLELAGQRPLLLEFDLTLPPSLLPHLRPAGGLHLVTPEIVDEAGFAAAAARSERWWSPGLDHLDRDEPQTRRVLYYRAFLEAWYGCASAHAAWGERALARAQALLAGGVDPDLEQLSRRCRAP